jgi:hypothetical protein
MKFLWNSIHVNILIGLLLYMPVLLKIIALDSDVINY